MSRFNHDWQEIGRFKAVQERDLLDAEEYFLVAHDILEPISLSSTRLQYRGLLNCHDGIEIHVDHLLDRDHSNRVRTTRVKYHAQVGSPRVIPIVLYDNSDHYPEHPDAFHKHPFDDAGKQIGVEHIGRDAFPKLRDVIDEMFAWWKAHRDDPRYFPKR